MSLLFQGDALGADLLGTRDFELELFFELFGVIFRINKPCGKCLVGTLMGSNLSLQKSNKK